MLPLSPQQQECQPPPSHALPAPVVAQETSYLLTKERPPRVRELGNGGEMEAESCPPTCQAGPNGEKVSSVDAARQESLDKEEAEMLGTLPPLSHQRCYKVK